MWCIHRKYVARTVNTMLLSMGGFSFGRDLGMFIFGRDAHDMMVSGFIGAFIFFVFSMWMRRACRCNHNIR